MISKKKEYHEAFVWIWLPGKIDPIVAGRLSRPDTRSNIFVFNYGKSYLQRSDAISIYQPELPLQQGEISLLPGLSIPGCIRDASPDAWGRRVIVNRILGFKRENIDVDQLDELTYLLESGSDRIGALDFQQSATEYVPRSAIDVPLEDLIKSVERVEKGIPLQPELDQALFHGSSIGGARPKVLIQSDNKKYIAKFSSSSDLYSVVKSEFIAMRLAKLAGLDTASVKLKNVAGKEVLLVERFDRTKRDTHWQRHIIISALTILELDEMMARYASYTDLAEKIRRSFNDASVTLKELFGRIVFNILVGNTDDHARNHAAFWDGRALKLTSAYDICPQARAGNTASQGMAISDGSNISQLSVCIDAASHFHLKEEEAIKIISDQISVIAKNWNNVCNEADLKKTDRAFFWGRQFLNDFAFEGLKGDALRLKKQMEEMR